MAAVSPAGNAIFVNQAAPLVSQHVANAQNAVQFQASLAAQMFAEQNHNKVATVDKASEDHEIDEKEKKSPEWFEEKKKRKKKDEEGETEEFHSDHILDLKA